MVVSGAASKLETQDLVSVIASSLMGPRVRTLGSVAVLSLQDSDSEQSVFWEGTFISFR